MISCGYLHPLFNCVEEEQCQRTSRARKWRRPFGEASSCYSRCHGWGWRPVLSLNCGACKRKCGGGRIPVGACHLRFESCLIGAKRRCSCSRSSVAERFGHSKSSSKPTASSSTGVAPRPTATSRCTTRSRPTMARRTTPALQEAPTPGSSRTRATSARAAAPSGTDNSLQPSATQPGCVLIYLNVNRPNKLSRRFRCVSCLCAGPRATGIVLVVALVGSNPVMVGFHLFALASPSHH